ncbi:hypothetical protein F5144DRAFT_572494 [Chaetomium tenue]|uniref:Uncharacterized protein n=1 Tax=Chaetomium tenue TaxID=1854479 RepID=A0ACB7P6P5_9PEZI|nr:hypothetical protein F5144DRAFT_572494 [Chaetomium globosum]
MGRRKRKREEGDREGREGHTHTCADGLRYITVRLLHSVVLFSMSSFWLSLSFLSFFLFFLLWLTSVCLLLFHSGTTALASIRRRQNQTLTLSSPLRSILFLAVLLFFCFSPASAVIPFLY